ncbi:hypothetical protein U9M48_018398 [Paspalum notatum var. saurae]|uniref:Reverse transcriptase n=1 Tax=Paspalum notatum var. saurae TaxID=547442 RepID=A0AAQ3TD05_PASNO
MELDRLQQTPVKPAPRALLPAPAPRPALPAGPAPLALLAPALPALPAPPPALPAPQIRGGANQAKSLSPEEQAERRRLGLCYNCNEPYSRGHNRVCRRIFYIDGIELAPAAPAADEDAPVFSLRAVAGMPICDTMQVHVTVGAASFTALLDTGSTHNFIAEAAASRTGLRAHADPRLTATVANGERISCPGVFRQAPLTIAGEEFCVDLYIMPLAGYDLVLGTQWMVTLGPIVWDFTKRTMAFTRHGRPVCWDDVTARRTPLLAATSPRRPSSTSCCPALRVSSPSRPVCHRSALATTVSSSSQARCRWRSGRIGTHKDELERQCTTMIAQGIVRRNDSAFSSPVLLVKKPDGTWRFCVDYRAINALTVKDAFPIPVVDELLDELHGACFFTKLDLRSGYHQVRMHPSDVHKTAFRTHDGLYEFLVMAFGLCNAPATFQALMNDVLRPFLRRFVLVFFDDILIYSRTWADHLRHIRAVFDVLQQHRLFLKRAKCAFTASSVAYLGHVVSAAGVAMDPTKVQAVRDWLQLRSARAVRGFLGLTGYYRKFVHNYRTIAAPLTALLRKEGFSWSPEAAAAFAALKDAVTSAPVLALPDFTKLFVVECGASSHGFRAVLVQDSHPIAFFSRPVAARHRALAAYERELIGLVHAIRHWRPYLWGRHFIVKTDHYSLKYLLDQRLSTIPQHHWVGKLLGFNFAVEFKPGHSNAVADALSRRDTPEDSAVLVLSAPRFDFIDRLRQAHATDPALLALQDEIRAGSRPLPWALADGLVQYNGRLYIPPTSPLLQEVLVAVHEEGHEGVQRTLHRLRRDFHFPNMRRAVQDLVRACAVCQRNKSEHLHPVGLLLPLPVPQGVWTDVAMDFVEALPRVRGKSVILTVIDRFSKYCHFIPLAHPYSAESVAQAFFAEIVRLHGIPQSIVSDRDTVFTSNFWRELMRLSGTKLQMSTAFHPQSDGQSESANRVIIMYLRCLTGDQPRDWLRWLPWAEYVFNTAFQSSPRETPFRVVYGRDPPSIRSYEPGETRVAAVAKTMEERTEFLEDIRIRLEQAQAVQKRHYDRVHRSVHFQVGDWVLLRLRQRAAASLPQATSGKLKPRFYGSYRIVELINNVAVRLALPQQARLHDVFHVGLLKKFHGDPPQAPPPLPAVRHGAVVPEPARAVKARRARGVRQVLIHWKGASPASAT